MELRFDPDGEVTIVAGTLSHGQGHETTYAQMVADWLGMPEDKIHLAQADTDEVAIGRGTYASRSMMIGGSALRAAADELIERGKRFAAHFMEADAADIAFADGAFTIAGTDRSMPIGQVAQMSFIPVGLPPRSVLGCRVRARFPRMCRASPMAATSAKSRSTPRPARSQSTATPSSTMSARSSTRYWRRGRSGRRRPGRRPGAAGRRRLDHDSGQLVTGTLMDYALPRADMLPTITIDFSPVPSPTNPLGAKGVGEGGTVAATPAVMNAILDALARGRHRSADAGDARADLAGDPEHTAR